MKTNVKLIDKRIYLKFSKVMPKEEIIFILNYVREYFDEKMPIIITEKPFAKSHIFCHRYQNFEVALYSKYIILYIQIDDDKKFNPLENILNNKHLLN